MIVVHLNQLDVIRRAQIAPGESLPPPAVREEIELFSQAVTPSLLGYVSEAPINIVIGLLDLILDHTNILLVSRTKIGLVILTMLLSRAELVKDTGSVSNLDWQEWTNLCNRLFDTLEPILGGVFPGSVSAGEDMYVWQFLAAVGIGASPEQQQRLVMAVK
jgi:DNA topoisomerase 2-associated protein PAT1